MIPSTFLFDPPRLLDFGIFRENEIFQKDFGLFEFHISIRNSIQYVFAFEKAMKCLFTICQKLNRFVHVHKDLENW